MAELGDWDKTESGNNTGATPDYPIEGWAPSTMNATVREGMAVHARHHADTNGTLSSGGSSNAYTLTANRTLSAYALGLVMVFRANHTNTGAATLNVSALGVKSIVRPSGDALLEGEIVNGGTYMVFYDGTNFQLLNAAYRKANTTYYVATTGSDSNAGTSSAPFLTVQKALDTIVANHDDTARYYVDIAAGTYQEALQPSENLNGRYPVTLRGPDVSSGTPTAIIDGNAQALTNGIITPPFGYIQLEDLMFRNFSRDGVSVRKMCNVACYNVHANGNGRAGLNVSHGRCEVFGGKFDDNDEYGLRSYSQSELSIEADTRNGTVGLQAFGNTLHDINMRENSQGRLDDFTCGEASVKDAGKTSIQIHGSARAHLHDYTVQNVGIGVRTRRNASWQEDNGTFTNVDNHFENQSFGVEISNADGHSKLQVAQSNNAVTHTGSTAATDIASMFTIPASYFKNASKSYEIEIWGEVVNVGSGTKTIRVTLDNNNMTEAVTGAGADGDFWYKVILMAQGSASQKARGIFLLDGATANPTAASRTVDMTAARVIKIRGVLGNASDSIIIHRWAVSQIG